MTKSTITRDQITSWMNDANYTLEEPLNADDAAAARAILAMGHELLSAMDGEPVFTLEVSQADYKGQKLGNHFGFIALDAARKLKEGNYQLYRHAQPAPVVPDAYVRDEHGRMMLNGVCEPKIGFGTGWNACRAAMLKAQPQNAPQNIPEIIPGWIQVSERMPPSRHEVLVGCWWGEKPR